MKKKRVVAVLLFFAFVFSACGFNGDDTRDLADEPSVREEFMLGTLVSIQVFDEGKEEAMNKAFHRVDELDGMFSMMDENSEVYQINQAAGKEPVQVSDEVFYVVERALEYSAISDGGFDPTIGALTDLWGIGYDHANVPDQASIDQLLALVDYQKVTLDEANKTVFLEEEGMKLDLNAIAKGFITDEATKVLTNEGVTTAIVDLGGDIYVVGASMRAVNAPWRVGIQDPFRDRGQITGIAPVQDEAIVTSGIYERTIEENGQSYHHLLDPKTGYPFDNELAGLSIVAENAMMGDALATSVFSMGLEEGLSYVDSNQDLEAVFVTKDREIYLSSGYEKKFEITNTEEFTLAQ